MVSEDLLANHQQIVNTERRWRSLLATLSDLMIEGDEREKLVTQFRAAETKMADLFEHKRALLAQGGA